MFPALASPDRPCILCGRSVEALGAVRDAVDTARAALAVQVDALRAARALPHETDPERRRRLVMASRAYRALDTEVGRVLTRARNLQASELGYCLRCADSGAIVAAPLPALPLPQGRGVRPMPRWRITDAPLLGGAREAATPALHLRQVELEVTGEVYPRGSQC